MLELSLSKLQCIAPCQIYTNGLTFDSSLLPFDVASLWSETVLVDHWITILSTWSPNLVRRCHWCAAYLSCRARLLCARVRSGPDWAGRTRVRGSSGAAPGSPTPGSRGWHHTAATPTVGPPHLTTNQPGQHGPHCPHSSKYLCPKM